MQDRPSPLPLKALQAFEAAVRLGGMGRAADHLGVTHGAISRQIGLLQRRLGAPLFEGPRNARRPTAEAERLWAEIAPAFASMTRALADRTTATRLVRVSCLSTLAARWLIPRLSRFAEQQPTIRIELTESYAPLDRALDGGDLAIRMWSENGRAPAGLTATGFMANAVGLVVAPSRQADPSPRRLASRSHPQAWRDWSRLTGVPFDPAPGLLFDHQQTMIEAVLAGLGVAIAQQALVQADLDQGRLVAPQGFTGDGAVFAVFHRRDDLSVAARGFVAWLKAEGAGL